MPCLLKATDWKLTVWFYRICLCSTSQRDMQRGEKGRWGFDVEVEWMDAATTCMRRWVFPPWDCLASSPPPFSTPHHQHLKHPRVFLSRFAVLIKILWALIGYNERSLNSGKCEDCSVELNRLRFWEESSGVGRYWKYYIFHKNRATNFPLLFCSASTGVTQTC